jgi:hypothetical protein
MELMKFKSFFFDRFDNLTKIMIFLFDFFCKYILCINKNIFLFGYFLKNKFVLHRFSFLNFFYGVGLMVFSFFPFFTMLCGELLVFSFPIIIFCFYFLNFFLFHSLIDYLEEIELVEFFVQSLEVILWSNFKYIYILFYIIYIYRFLVNFFYFYFDQLLSVLRDDVLYFWICKVFVVRRYIKFLLGI